MLAKIFKKTSTPKGPGVSPAIARLNQFGTRSAICTVVADGQGQDTNEEVGLVSLYASPNRLYSREGFIYLAPPPQATTTRQVRYGVVENEFS